MPIFECSRCNDLTYSSSMDAAGTCARCGSEHHRVLEGGFGEARESTRDLAEADHATLVYDDVERVAPFCARYLTEGIDAGEHVMAGVQEDLREAVSPLLAPDVEALVEWHDLDDIYGDFDADRIAAMYDERIGSEPRTTRILAGLSRECADGVAPEEFDRYEAAAHRIITSRGAIAICLYDTRAIPPELLPASAKRHTLTVEDGAVRRNQQFEYEPA
jgi:hypothetical protein